MNIAPVFSDPFKQDNNPNLSFLFSQLERIDLVLQYHFHCITGQRSDLLDEFLLSEEDVIARLDKPLGKPHWVNDDYLAIPQTVNPVASRLADLIARFELTDFERDVLLLGLLPHFDSRYYRLFALIQGEQQSRLPCFALALELFCHSPLEKQAQQASFLHRAPLIGCQLLSVDSRQKTLTWLQTAFVTDSGVYHFLLGHHYITPALEHSAEWITPIEIGGYPAGLKQALGNLLLSDHDDIRPLVLLRGMAGSARAHAVANMMASEKRQTLWVDIAKLADGDDKTTLLQIKHILRETRMRGACLLLQNFCLLAEKNKQLLDSLSALLNQPELRVVCLVEPYSPLVWLKKISTLLVEMPVFTSVEKNRLLTANLPDNCSEDIDAITLSQRYAFNPETLPLILQEAQIYQQQRDPSGILQQCDIRKALNLRAQQNFGQLAQRITPKRSLKDLLVSDEVAQQIQEILMAIKYREQILAGGFKDKIGYGTGISALFYGDSGTGKTMAAEVIADCIGVDLIKVDLSTVVNKYVGETEKNLSRIFDLAEQDAGVLFFDEADALFGKRSETKDAQDRHANIEVSYLLQRLENFPGLVILSTNNRSHLDSAFNRRFTFITRFTYPDENTRKEMWQTIWPKNIKVSQNVDFNELAQRTSVTGANIRNIALLSSFFAAGEGNNEINNENIEIALARELAKMGRLSF
ncbi:ATP-binding protein [Xenorhabdus bovienii]|uniref:ATP-binding protein n=1 Tax=Xenorhabdus bovienii TaxID=40576 RepID=UPI0023B3386E|nr:AAA family ATPase [Xenorhabdus bovienii]MDE9441385.1 AAA family ATPase [Xenorhabdus bovienii]MDE9457615.1 AAA family ATPase [Xenorhabdus bovienii]MDE9465881.1 AAA family ATPase [Xenorhabdus bovienii]MDE9514492.1 AAA family ATPase [Xenorhabdus bovienii]